MHWLLGLGRLIDREDISFAIYSSDRKEQKDTAKEHDDLEL